MKHFERNMRYLLWFKHSINTNTTPVEREWRQGQKDKGCIMVFVKKRAILSGRTERTLQFVDAATRTTLQLGPT